MELNLILIIVGSFIVTVIITSFVVNFRANNKIREYQSISDAIKLSTTNLASMEKKLSVTKIQLEKLDQETKNLQELKANAEKISSELSFNTEQLNNIISDMKQTTTAKDIQKKNLHELMSKIDIYTQLEEFIDYGHFETPEYLHDTSARFAEEIKRVRESQKELIKNKEAVISPDGVTPSGDIKTGRKILEGQKKLMLTAFNIESDSLIGKVSPSSFPRTLERIEKLANTIEKSASTLHCGFSIDYVDLKFQECRLQYQFTLKKKEEQDEQRLIKEQLREEQRAIKEFEKAIAEAEKEEQLYKGLLEKARKELQFATDDEKIIAEQRIAELEMQLQEAESKEERAKSMAQQTRKGHVYVISNIGSFGENVYKIGLTRRLEPMDRVKELGDASVPFSFDVHAMIYVEDAPTLERDLHREFTNSRVNAVNLRKEFFRTDLESIRLAVEKILGVNAEFKTTVLAEEYFESRRMITDIT